MQALDPDKRERSPLVIAASIVLPLLPILYVLSIGPVVWLNYHNHLSPEFVSAFAWFHYPITWLTNHCEPFGHFMLWYVELWADVVP